MTRRKTPRNRDIAKGIVDEWATQRAAEIDQSLQVDPYAWLRDRLDLELRRQTADLTIDLIAELWDAL